jgi:glutathione S-transferase
MELYYSTNSPYARAVRIAMRELGMMEGVTETRATRLRQPDNTVLDHSPLGRVPTLVTDEGVGLTEARIICTWLEHRAGGRALLGAPDDATALAQDGLITGFTEGLVNWVHEIRRDEAQRSTAMIAHEAARAERCLAALEAQPLPSLPAYRAALLVAALGLLDSFGFVPEWRAHYPELAAWAARQAERPSVSETVPM